MRQPKVAHFLEAVRAQPAVRILQPQPAIRSHRDQLGIKPAVLILERTDPLPAVKLSQIPAVDGLRRTFRLSQFHGELLKDGIEQSLAIHLLPYRFLERNRIGSIAEETGLIDIQSDTDNRLTDRISHKSILYQDAAKLTVTDINVIGPLDAGLYLPPLQSPDYSQRYRHRQDKLPAGLDLSGMVLQ